MVCLHLLRQWLAELNEFLNSVTQCFTLKHPVQPLLAATFLLPSLGSSAMVVPLKKLVNKLIQPALCLGSCRYLLMRRMQHMATAYVAKLRGLMCMAIASSILDQKT
jgi:hypothetical protein